MPRPPVDRVARSVRLTKITDERLVERAGRRGLSINNALEDAVLLWLRQDREVVPNFKRGS